MERDGIIRILAIIVGILFMLGGSAGWFFWGLPGVLSAIIVVIGIVLVVAAFMHQFYNEDS